MFAYNLCAGLMRAIGNSVMPLVFLVVSSVLNIILDLVFITQLNMGVQGAAVATVDFSRNFRYFVYHLYV